MKGLLTQSLHAMIHIYFMYWTFTFYPDRTWLTFWNQIKFFTIFSNVNMFLFLIPSLWREYQNFRSGTQTLHSHSSHLTFQLMMPVIMVVTIMYWLLYCINPALLFGSKNPDDADDILMLYLHGGNLAVMFLVHHVEPQPHIHLSKKAKWFIFYTFVYFCIYGVNYLAQGEHVYGFQEMMTPFHQFMMYASLFIIFFVLDYLLSKIIYKSSHPIKNKIKL